MHIAWIIANNSSVHYFNWFAEQAAKEKDIRFTFICLYPTRPKMVEEVKKFGWDCHWLYFDHHQRKTGIVSLVPKLYRLLKKLKPDVLHAHLFDDSVPALLAARLSGVKTRVITKADTTFHYLHYPHWMWFDLLNNWNATHIVAISSQSKKFLLEKEKVKAEKISLIHHGILLEKATHQSEEVKKKLRARFGINDELVIGTISRFIEWKGHRSIIEAAEIIVKKYPKVRFLFTGNGELEEEFRTLADKKHLKNHITFTGPIDYAEIPSLYGIMDIYLHAAINEPFGFVIAEAMANGVPVISTRTGAALDGIEHLKSGYFIPEKDPQEIANAVFFMIGNNRKKIGEEGRQSAMQHYSFEKMYRNHMNLYQQALKK